MTILVAVTVTMTMMTMMMRMIMMMIRDSWIWEQNITCPNIKVQTKFEELSTFTTLCINIHASLVLCISVQITSRFQQRIGDIVTIAENKSYNISTLIQINKSKMDNHNDPSHHYLLLLETMATTTECLIYKEKVRHMHPLVSLALVRAHGWMLLWWTDRQQLPPLDALAQAVLHKGLICGF